MRFCLELSLRVVVLATSTLASLAAESVIPEPAGAPRVISVVRADARTGRLVRSLKLEAEPAAAKPGEAPDSAVRALVEQAAQAFDVNPQLVDSVIQVESNYNAFAVSPKGARGLMQLMPATAQRFGVTDTFDPKQNIDGGVRYLKFLEDTFQDDRLAIAAYNAGEKAVAKYKDVPPYAETKDYVAKVGKKYSQAKRASSPSKPAPAAEQPKPAPTQDETRHILAFVDQQGRLHIVTR
jgi:soluble lytic murein transglycosylase-like protein